MRGCAFLAVVFFLIGSGCGGDKPRFTEEEMRQIAPPQRTGLPSVSGGLALAVCGETITADEIAVPSVVDHFRADAQRNGPEQFKAQARGTVEGLVGIRILDILRHEQAKKDVKGNIDEALEKIVEGEVKRFVVRFGGDWAKAEEALKEMGLDWQSFREEQKKRILVEFFVRKKLPEEKPVTHGELKAGYEERKDESFAIEATLRIWLMDVVLGNLQVSEAGKSAEQLGKEVAEELAGRLRAGGNWGELAEEYSEKYGQRCVVWRTVRAGSSLAEPYDVLAREAEKMEAGQLCGPIEVNGHILIMKVVEKQSEGFEAFEKVQKQVEDEIIAQRREKADSKFWAALIERAEIANREAFVDFCLDKIYRMARQ